MRAPAFALSPLLTLLAPGQLLAQARAAQPCGDAARAEPAPDAPSVPAHAARAPEPAPAQPEPAPPEPAPAPPPVAEPSNACALAAPVARVELRTREQLAVSLRVVPAGAGARAWVTLARPSRNAREGLQFPSARLVHLEGPTAPPRVLDAPGTESDPELVALGERTLVLSSLRAASPGQPMPLSALVVDAQGRAVAPARVLEGTEGATVDSPVVATPDGAAVLLGRVQGNDASETGLRRVREELWRLDPQGAPRGTSVLVTERQADDALGRHRAGLAWASAQGELVLTWTQRAGSESSVWARRYAEGAWLADPERIAVDAARPLWGSAARTDGTGVLYRSGGERGEPARWHVTGWGRRQSAVLGQGYDAQAALVDGRALVLAGEDEASPDALLVETNPRSGERRALTAEPALAASLRDAADVELVPLAHGALAAWLEGGTEAEPGARALRVAWVRCPVSR